MSITQRGYLPKLLTLWGGCWLVFWDCVCCCWGCCCCCCDNPNGNRFGELLEPLKQTKQQSIHRPTLLLPTSMNHFFTCLMQGSSNLFPQGPDSSIKGAGPQCSIKIRAWCISMLYLCRGPGRSATIEIRAWCIFSLAIFKHDTAIQTSDYVA